MPAFVYSESQFAFPDLSLADEEGLLLIGGKVTSERVLEAYSKGIFPWYNEDEVPLWWSPDPRFVLFPNELHISRSMRKILRQDRFQFRMNTAFEQVITACASIEREGQDGTWITGDIASVYTSLYRQGHAHSAEAWQDDELVGGVYGIRIGRVFFGESMFSKAPNASKFALIKLATRLKDEGLELFDCQVYSSHVESLGARLIERTKFVDLLRRFLPLDT